MDYDYIYYCANCGVPVHISRVLSGYRCECGGTGFVSAKDFDICRYFKESR